MDKDSSKRLLSEVRSSTHRFTPADALPVVINYQDQVNPFELAEPVRYRNGPLTVTIPKGFKCDATSTPGIVFQVPALANLLAMGLWLASCERWAILCWAASTLLAVVIPYAMPAVGQLGLHARAAVVHDVLYRTQTVSRVVADAVMYEVMEYDRVRWLPRWAIFLLLRVCGGRAWRENAKRLVSVPFDADTGHSELDL